MDERWRARGGYGRAARVGVWAASEVWVTRPGDDQALPGTDRGAGPGGLGGGGSGAAAPNREGRGERAAARRGGTRAAAAPPLFFKRGGRPSTGGSTRHALPTGSTWMWWLWEEASMCDWREQGPCTPRARVKGEQRRWDTPRSPPPCGERGLWVEPTCRPRAPAELGSRAPGWVGQIMAHRHRVMGRGTGAWTHRAPRSPLSISIDPRGREGVGGSRSLSPPLSQSVSHLQSRRPPTAPAQTRRPDE